VSKTKVGIEKILKEYLRLGSEGYANSIQRKIDKEERQIREHQENIRSLRSQIPKPL